VLTDVYRPASSEDATGERKSDLETAKPVEQRELKVTG
jgi:hypothetical protein